MSFTVKPGKGFPETNYGVLWRNAHESDRRPNAMIIPRRKYTFLAEFTINPDYLSDIGSHVTNISTMTNDHTLIAPLVSIQRPQPKYRTETLNSYNRKYNVVLKEEMVNTTLVFHDDMASVAATILKEHRNFYHNVAGLKKRVSDIESLPTGSFVTDNLSYLQKRYGTTSAQSMGMRLRKSSYISFFDSLTIYDLGGDPDSVNIDTFIYPTITDITRDGASYEDRTGNQGMSMAFNCTEHHSFVGVNTSEVSHIIEKMLMAPPYTKSASGNHGRDR